jgi:hypothetical protein
VSSALCCRNNKKLNGIYVYLQTQLYSGGKFTNAKAQLHVSAINVGHLQVVHEKLSIRYAKVCGEFIGCGKG